MDPWAPINGISLERYADLAADVADTQDPAAQAQIVGAKGVSPVDWEAAKAGWTARMQDMSLMGQVATRFMPMYQAALARRNAGAPGPQTQVSYEDYVGMCGCPPVMGIEAMLAHYRLTMAQWTQIAGHWNGIIATNPQYMQHGLRVEQEAARIRSGGAPRPVAMGVQGGSVAPPGGPPPVEPGMQAVSGAMPGAVPPPGYGAPPAAPPGYASQAPPGYASQAPPGYASQAPPGYAPQAAPPGHPPQAAPPGYPPPPQQGWPQPQQGYRPAPGYNSQASAFGNEVGNAFSAFGSALGSVVNSVVGTFSYGQAVMVQWSDGQRYPATVMIQQSGQVQVAFPDGRQVWVPQHCVVIR